MTLLAAASTSLPATPALAAQTEPGYHLLYALSPAAAQFFQPVQKACTDSGVTVEVASVRVEDDTAQAYIALRGEAVDANIDLFDSYSFHFPFDQTSHCERAGFDPETNTAFFLVTARTMDGSDIPLGGKMSFSLGCFLTGKQALEGEEVSLKLSDYAGEAGTAEDFLRTGGGGNLELMDSAPMLRSVPRSALPGRRHSAGQPRPAVAGGRRGNAFEEPGFRRLCRSQGGRRPAGLR